MTKPIDGMDWHSATIDDDTLITPSYKNTQNVRRYFQSRCGEHFKFDRDFMAWIKASKGKTMGDAVKEWLRRQTED